jgi:hypothetical protein
MPLIDDLHRANRDIVFRVMDALPEIKFSTKRRRWLIELVGERTPGTGRCKKAGFQIAL